MEADVVKLVDTLVLGTSALSREGSSPFIRTNKEKPGCNATGLFVGMQPLRGPPIFCTAKVGNPVYHDFMITK